MSGHPIETRHSFQVAPTGHSEAERAAVEARLKEIIDEVEQRRETSMPLETLKME